MRISKPSISIIFLFYLFFTADFSLGIRISYLLFAGDCLNLEKDLAKYSDLSRSDLAKMLNIGIQHVTRLENLPVIIRSGALKSLRALGKAQDRPAYDMRYAGVFLALRPDLFRGRNMYEDTAVLEFQNLDTKKNYEINIVLEFKTEILNRDDFHTINDWAFGSTARGSKSAYYPKDFGKYVFEEFLPSAWLHNEVVFYNEVPVIYLKEISVPPGGKKPVENFLQNQGIKEINGKSIEEIVVERTVFP